MPTYLFTFLTTLSADQTTMAAEVVQWPYNGRRSLPLVSLAYRWEPNLISPSTYIPFFLFACTD